MKKQIFVFIAFCMIAGTAQASIVYKWTTPDGVNHIGDVIPTGNLKDGYEVINQSTWEIKAVFVSLFPRDVNCVKMRT